MRISAQLTILDCAVAADGGSLQLRVRDAEGDEHDLVLVQHELLENHSAGHVPGRLYWDDEIVGIRSPEESALIRALESPAVDHRSEDDAGSTGDGVVEELSAEEIEADLLECAAEIRAFVCSDEYLRVAERLRAE